MLLLAAISFSVFQCILQSLVCRFSVHRPVSSTNHFATTGRDELLMFEMGLSQQSWAIKCMIYGYKQKSSIGRAIHLFLRYLISYYMDLLSSDWPDTPVRVFMQFFCILNGPDLHRRQSLCGSGETMCRGCGQLFPQWTKFDDLRNLVYCAQCSARRFDTASQMFSSVSL